MFVDSRNRLGGVFWRANHSKINETERRSFPSYIDHNALHLCTSVKKADAPTMNKKDDGTVECTYSDPEQLYFDDIIELICIRIGTIYTSILIFCHGRLVRFANFRTKEQTLGRHMWRYERIASCFRIVIPPIKHPS